MDIREKQAIWLIEKKNITVTDCPPFESLEKTGCEYCIVHKFNGNGCSIDRKIKAANWILRKNKLERILK